jgi:hypothetical protein
MSDNYEFMKTSEAQDATDYSPYSDKQYNNYINDINNGVYTNNSLTLINFDLGQIYNSQKFTETSELFAVLPIAMVAGFSTNATGGTLINPTSKSQALCTIKSNFLNLIHQADVVVNGRSIEQCQPFINIARHFQLISEMSVNDLATLGHSLGFSPTLDNTKSAKYQSTYASTAGGSGNGYTNNRVFSSSSDNQTTPGDANASTGNTANQYKVGRYVDITNTTGQGIYGTTNTLMTGTQIQNEFRPYYTTANGYMIWHDFAVIKLNYLFESLNKIGLTKKLDAQLRLWVNTGTVMVRVDGADGSNLAYNMTPADNTFSNTCPMLVNYQSSGSAGGSIVPIATKAIVAGLYIKQPPVTSFAGLNLAASSVQHPLTNCRLYYSSITVDTEKAVDYVQRNRNKKVIFRSFVTNSYNNIGTGSSFNALVNSGITHPTGILICPFIAATTGAQSGFGDYQWKSPFDTCPATMSPLSLINLQVGIGGQNVLNSTLSMTYENFLQQVNLAEQLTSSDFGVSTGLISQGYWEQSKWYFVNVERGNIGDKLQPRNINVSFNNNSNVPIDVIIFTFYNDQLEIDVETGIVTK